jgi:hypothetical protein
MSVATGTTAGSNSKLTSIIGLATMVLASANKLPALMAAIKRLAAADLEIEDEQVHEMGQMGAKRIGSLAIGIAVVGLVLNEMSGIDTFSNSSGVIDIQSIFDTAGSGLQILVVGVIIAAAAVLLNLWSGF